MTDETRNLLIGRYGMTAQQIDSKGVHLFIQACASEEWLLEKAMAEEVEALRNERDDLAKWIAKVQKLLSKDMPWLQENIARLKEEKKQAEEKLAAIKQQILEESIDDRRTRNFLNMVCWFKDNDFTEQEIKSFCNIGKGFFGGWIDPPEEIGRDDDRWAKGINQDKTRWRTIV